jgi:high-affinity Fe2+/Pb2+ permease
MEIQNEDTNGLSTSYDEIKAIHMEGYAIGVKRAKICMLIVAAMTAIFAIIVYNNYNGDVNYLFWLLMVAPIAIYLTLAFLSNKIPYLSIILALIMYIGLWVANYFIGRFESGIAGNIILKVIIISYMSWGLKDAKKLEEARRETI